MYEHCRNLFLNTCIFPVPNAKLLYFSIQGYKLFPRNVTFNPNIRFEANRFRGSALTLCKFLEDKSSCTDKGGGLPNLVSCLWKKRHENLQLMQNNLSQRKKKIPTHKYGELFSSKKHYNCCCSSAYSSCPLICL